MDFPGSSDSKASACKVGDPRSVPGSGRSPGEGNGNHSSILAWKIPWVVEPGRLQSMGLQRIGHNRATSLSLLVDIISFIISGILNLMKYSDSFLKIHTLTANMQSTFCALTSFSFTIIP